MIMRPQWLYICTMIGFVAAAEHCTSRGLLAMRSSLCFRSLLWKVKGSLSTSAINGANPSNRDRYNAAVATFKHSYTSTCFCVLLIAIARWHTSAVLNKRIAGVHACTSAKAEGLVMVYVLLWRSEKNCHSDSYFKTTCRLHNTCCQSFYEAA